MMITIRVSHRLLAVPNSTSRSYLLPKTSASFPSFPSPRVQAATFFNDSSVQSKSKQSGKIAREPWFTRRRKGRNPRSKISTLAPDRLLFPFQENTSYTDRGDEQHEREQKNQHKHQSASQTLSPGIRRMLLWTTVLTMPLWGRDIIEVVVPGTIGIFILVAGKIKAAVQWTGSAFSISEK